MTPHPRTFLHAVASYGLPGAGAELPQQPLDAASWDHLLALVADQQLVGHLVAAITDGRMVATEEQADAAVSAHAAALRHVLRLERRLLDVTAMLDDAGYPYRALKGSAVAHTVYPDPAVRLFTDVDLLVRGDDFDDASVLLAAAGIQRRTPPLRPGFDRRFGKGATLVAADGLEIDLHRTFLTGFFGLSVDLDELFATEERVVVGGRPVTTLDREARFLHACYHAAFKPAPPLVSLRDIAQFLLSTDVDADLVLRRAAAWSGELLVARSVQRAWDVLGIADSVPLSSWAATFRPDPQEQRLVAAYVGRRPSEAARAVTALRAVPGVGDKAAFLRAMLMPDRTYLASRGSGRAAWLVRSHRGLRWRQEPS